MPHLSTPLPRVLRRLRLAGAALALVLGAALPAAAQDPLPPTPRPPDTALVPVPPGQQEEDTLPEALAPDSVTPDSLVPAPSLPTFAREGGGTWSGTWAWDREGLEFFHGLSLLDLLERVPGLVVTRTGSFGQPVGLAPYALGGGRVRVFLDGYELLPLGGSVFDVQRIPLVELEAVRVEAGLAETRVYLTTYRLADVRPYAELEAGDGDFGTKVLRLFFARPLGERWVLKVGYDVVDTDGYRRAAPFSTTSYMGRLGRSWGAGRAVELEYRKTAADRREVQTTGGVPGLGPFPESVDRTDVVLRGAWALGEGLRLFGAAGRSRRERAGADTSAFEGEATHLALTADVPFRGGTLSATGRVVRGDGGGFALDQSEAALRAVLEPTARLGLVGEARYRAVGGEGGLETELSARLSPFGALSFFGSISAGTRGIPFVGDTLVTSLELVGVGDPAGPRVDSVFLPRFGVASTSLNALRAGAELRLWDGVLGAALVRSDADRVVPFGLGFDAGLDPVEVGAATMVEAYADLPLYVPWLRMDGWYLFAPETGGRPFLSDHQARLALEYHDRFYGGNLEPTVRLETLARSGGALTLARGPEGAPERSGATESYALINFFLQVRVLDVRVFLLAENLLNQREAFDLVGQPLPGQRTMYGFRWFLRN